MKIAAVCCTYRRPKQLGEMIHCFEQQDYPRELRELVILDDAGQYGAHRGPGWRLVSTRSRFATLARKRNAAAALVSHDVDAIAVWDDDDLYLPWALRASAAALEDAAWSRPSVVLHPNPDGTLRQHATGGLFHGGWAYRRSLFLAAGGYPPEANNGEDRGLAARFERILAVEADPIALGFRPFYVFRWGTSSGDRHVSGLGPRGYDHLAAPPCDTLLTAGKKWAAKPPAAIDLTSPVILPTVHPRMF